MIDLLGYFIIFPDQATQMATFVIDVLYFVHTPYSVISYYFNFK